MPGSCTTILACQRDRDPDHPEHEDYVEWIGGEFDPEAFDLEAVNVALRPFRHGRYR